MVGAVIYFGTALFRTRLRQRSGRAQVIEWGRNQRLRKNMGPHSSGSRSEWSPTNAGFLLNFLEAGFHRHPGSDDFALHMGEQIACLVVLVDGECAGG